MICCIKRSGDTANPWGTATYVASSKVIQMTHREIVRHGKPLGTAIYVASSEII